MGIFERISALAGSELSKATNLAHETFGQRMGEHGHSGRALIESIAQVCRNHPNLVGIGVGFLVEQLLIHEKHRYEALHGPGSSELPPGTDTAVVAPAPAPHPQVVPNLHLPHPHLKFSNLKPGKIAWEVFGGLILLKLAATGVKMFRHKHQGESWFAPIAKIHLFSGTFAAYYFAKSLKSPKISAWRNAAVALFATDAIKPVLKLDKKRARQLAAQRLEKQKAAAAEAARQAAAQPAPAPAPAQVYVQPAPAPQEQPAPETHVQPQPAPVEQQPDYQKAAAVAEPDAALGQGRVLHPVNIGAPPSTAPFSIVPPPQPEPDAPTQH
ncbi:MAG: hypothetical protein JSR45_06060 [Proteobacteria bacterium]|nr:hypothetical protein [Pseudomonadota bacterium]